MICGDYSTLGMEGGKGVNQTEAQRLILEPTTNRQIQANLTNKGLMNINQIFVMGIN